MTQSASERVLSKYWDGYLPVNIEDIIKKSEIKIKLKNDLNDDYCGYADEDNEGCFIVVNANHSINRQRFTLAHELGHHLLNHELPRDRDEISAFGMDFYEIEANEFAASMLMPVEAVKALVNGDDIDIDELAEQFQVSSAAMFYRLKNLGMVSFNHV